MREKSRFRLIALVIILVLAVLSAGSVLLLNRNPEGWLFRLLERTTLVLSPKPQAFGAFHLISLGGCVLLTLLAVCLTWRVPAERREQTADCTVFAAGTVFALLELYKQLYCYWILGNGVYDFSVFPFQFCSLPIYFCLTTPLLPNGRAKDACYSFLALFGTVGGYLVMGYPSLPASLPLCLHTMGWHTLMIMLGGFLLVIRGIGGNFRRDYLPAAGIFLGALTLATLLNVVLEPVAQRFTGVLNLFYMSPYHSTNFWVISDVQRLFGWVPSMLCYILMFLILGAYPLWLLGKGLRSLQKKGWSDVQK